VQAHLSRRALDNDYRRGSLPLASCMYVAMPLRHTHRAQRKGAGGSASMTHSRAALRNNEMAWRKEQWRNQAGVAGRKDGQWRDGGGHLRRGRR